MSTRFRCRNPPPSTASWAPNFASCRGPPSSLDHGELSRGSRDRSIAGPPTSTRKPRDKIARDRRDPRMDAVGAGRALDVYYDAAGDQTLTRRAFSGLAAFS